MGIAVLRKLGVGRSATSKKQNSLGEKPKANYGSSEKTPAETLSRRGLKSFIDFKLKGLSNLLAD